MNDKQADLKKRFGFWLGAAAALLAGGLLVWGLGVWADRGLRSDLLLQTRLVARAVDGESVKKLAGAEADLKTPYYKRLKEQLLSVRAANPDCRFIYLMGRRADGKIFMFVDSERAGSEDYSPPGQVYAEISEEDRRVFDTGAEAVTGPYPDRWGKWISGLSPIRDHRTGALTAVLGMDIDARDWEWAVAARMAMPGGPLLAFGLALALLYTRTRAHRLSGRLTAELRESEEKFSKAFQTAPYAVTITRAEDGKFIEVNGAFTSMTGFTREEAFADSSIGLKLWGDPEDRRRVVDELRSGRAIVGREYLFRKKSGELITGLFSAQFMQLGRASRVLSSINDITGRKQVELDLVKANRDLVEKNREMENFLYITTHDLRGPLVNIQGFSRNLVGDFKKLREAAKPAAPPEEVRCFLNGPAGKSIPIALNFITESVLKMDQVISSLLKVARAGQVEMLPAVLDANAVLESVLSELRNQLEEAESAVKTGDLPPCTADAAALSHIFANLLGNAVKYRSRTRKLEITVRGEKNSAATVLYTVTDNGSGIKALDLPKIWQLFFSGDNPDLKKGEGIGLTMVRRMTEANSGRIWAESKEGEGSSFFVEMPA